MSSGPRLPLELALRASSALMDLWSLRNAGGLVVGSVRRGRATVGDLEFTAPHTSPLGDTLYAAIDETIIRTKRGQAVRGFKPGFLYCQLAVALINRETGEQVQFPVEIHRWTPENRGWIETMRTGPVEFGKAFLVWWKQAYGIKPADQASIDGHLVDRGGKVVPVLSEEECFARANLYWIDPRSRDSVSLRDFKVVNV